MSNNKNINDRLIDIPNCDNHTPYCNNGTRIMSPAPAFDLDHTAIFGNALKMVNSNHTRDKFKNIPMIIGMPRRAGLESMARAAHSVSLGKSSYMLNHLLENREDYFNLAGNNTAHEPEFYNRQYALQTLLYPHVHQFNFEVAGGLPQTLTDRCTRKIGKSLSKWTTAAKIPPTLSWAKRKMESDQNVRGGPEMLRMQFDGKEWRHLYLRSVEVAMREANVDWFSGPDILKQHDKRDGFVFNNFMGDTIRRHRCNAYYLNGYTTMKYKTCFQRIPRLNTYVKIPDIIYQLIDNAVVIN